MNQLVHSNSVLAIDPARLFEVELLLGRYPLISGEETDQIVAFLRKASILDRALLNANKPLSDDIARFKQDHKAALRFQRADYVALAIVGAIIAFIGMSYYLL